MVSFNSPPQDIYVWPQSRYNQIIKGFILKAVLRCECFLWESQLADERDKMSDDTLISVSWKMHNLIIIIISMLTLCSIIDDQLIYQ